MTTSSDVPIAIVVPCYDEARRLDVGAFLAALDAWPALRLVLVDDGSTDGTRGLLQTIAAGRPGRAEVLALEVNGGKAEAVRQGLLQALKSDAACVGFWDADLATPLAEVAGFAAVLAARPDCDVVLGSRVRLLGREIRRRELRHYLGRVFATVASLAIRMPVYDTQCGAKLFRRTDRLQAALATPFLSRWAFDVELLARLRGDADDHRTFYELPLTAWTDVGASRLSAASALAAGLDLLRIGWRYRRPAVHPVRADASQPRAVSDAPPPVPIVRR